MLAMAEAERDWRRASSTAISDCSLANGGGEPDEPDEELVSVSLLEFALERRRFLGHSSSSGPTQLVSVMEMATPPATSRLASCRLLAVVTGR